MALEKARLVEAQNAQFFAFVRYIISAKIDAHLRNHKWELFARRYNGPSYAANNYHIKLDTAYQKHDKLVRARKTIKPEDHPFIAAAALLRCDEAAVRAVAEVEGAGTGFLRNGEPWILFEGHVFYRLTAGKFSKTHPDICHRYWDKKYYATGPTADARGVGELKRLARAKALDAEKAIMSASIGKFQILGENYKMCGYKSVLDLWAALSKSSVDKISRYA